MNLWAPFQQRLAPLAEQGPDRVRALVDCVLDEAVRAGASDVHFEPTHANLAIRARIDGVLQNAATLPRDLAPNVVARLKVLADLLTYRLDVPQEGRARSERPGLGDARISTFPTIHGERAVVRLFETRCGAMDLPDLGLPDVILDPLMRLLRDTSGVLLLTGPSGSGKTTTIYACLSHIVQATQRGRHIVTLEDPVETALEGVSQSQVSPAAGFDFARGMRSLLRQDPEVVMIGEIRDRETAQIAVEAGLTGHLVISTIHSGSAAGVVGRLLEMGIEPYLLTSSLRGIMNQRLVRRLCTHCAQPDAITGPRSHGCEHCLHTGYRGRRLLAEWLAVDADVRHAILERYDTPRLQSRLRDRGHRDLTQAAREAIACGDVALAEVHRVLGTDAPG